MAKENLGPRFSAFNQCSKTIMYVNTWTVSDENTRHKMGLAAATGDLGLLANNGRPIVGLAWISIRPWLVNSFDACLRPAYSPARDNRVLGTNGLLNFGTR